ncbi:hypothetical protein QFC24_006439 [Naganishia onofrii]|uniref:Uncharacterized protein n=1 Tax=Naganishia onofrii TaxID=1851511 RepID=A0ACC2X1S8_9TREE|nr:hypothetical protein QFC24_006439 [Naganishia onofrii]
MQDPERKAKGRTLRDADMMDDYRFFFVDAPAAESGNGEGGASGERSTIGEIEVDILPSLATGDVNPTENGHSNEARIEPIKALLPTIPSYLLIQALSHPQFNQPISSDGSDSDLDKLIRAAREATGAEDPVAESVPPPQTAAGTSRSTPATTDEALTPPVQQAAKKPYKRDNIWNDMPMDFGKLRVENEANEASLEAALDNMPAQLRDSIIRLSEQQVEEEEAERRAEMEERGARRSRAEAARISAGQGAAGRRNVQKTRIVAFEEELEDEEDALEASASPAASSYSPRGKEVKVEVEAPASSCFLLPLFINLIHSSIRPINSPHSSPSPHHPHRWTQGPVAIPIGLAEEEEEEKEEKQEKEVKNIEALEREQKLWAARFKGTAPKGRDQQQPRQQLAPPAVSTLRKTGFGPQLAQGGASVPPVTDGRVAPFYTPLRETDGTAANAGLGVFNTITCTPEYRGTSLDEPTQSCGVRTSASSRNQSAHRDTAVATTPLPPPPQSLASDPRPILPPPPQSLAAKRTLQEIQQELYDRAVPISEVEKRCFECQSEYRQQIEAFTNGSSDQVPTVNCAFYDPGRSHYIKGTGFNTLQWIYEKCVGCSKAGRVCEWPDESLAEVERKATTASLKRGMRNGQLMRYGYVSTPAQGQSAIGYKTVLS